MKQQLPSKIKVASMEYAIVEKEVVTIEGDRNYDGACSYYNEQIDIREGMSWNRKKNTFVHELLHAVMFEAGMYEHDEELINRLTPVLTQTLSNNDFSWMRK